jgi:transposase
VNQIFAKGNKRTLNKLIKLRKEAQQDGEYRVANRLHAIIMSLEGNSSGKISNILKVNRTRIPVWINSWNEHGENGLLEGYRSGRKTMMDTSMIETLQDIIESGPIAYGLDTGIWNSIIICKIIEDEFGVEYHPGHVRKILKKLGFSVQRPTVQLINAERKPANKWIRYTYPNFKKKRKAKME